MRGALFNTEDAPPRDLPKIRRAAMSLALAFLLAACGEVPRPSATPADARPSPAPTEGSPVSSPSPEPVSLVAPPELTLEDVPLKCGTPLVFGVEALNGPRGAEQADHPLAARLREMLADGSLPNRSGWVLVVLERDAALFLVPAAPGNDPDFWNAEFDLVDGSWEPHRFGQCDIQPAFEGSEAATWELVPGEEPDSDSMSFDVMVTEQACASGASPEGRIIGPGIVLTEDAVIVILGTRQPPGPQTCEPGPSARIRVELPEPLGDRQLFDGSTFPPEPRN